MDQLFVHQRTIVQEIIRTVVRVSQSFILLVEVQTALALLRILIDAWQILDDESPDRQRKVKRVHAQRENCQGNNHPCEVEVLSLHGGHITKVAGVPKDSTWFRRSQIWEVGRLVRILDGPHCVRPHKSVK